MPAQAGIQVLSRFKFNSRLDSGLHRDDGREKVDFESTNLDSLGLEQRDI